MLSQTPASTPRAPTLSRRQLVAAPNARGLLFTLLGELVLPCGGSAWTSSIIDVFARLGVEEKAARQALMRTAADGWLGSERFGRRTRWHLTGNSRRLLSDGAERIYSFTAVAESWAGQWLLVSAHVPEADRSARHVLRRRLSWAGFGTLAPGLWISPHPDREAEAIEALRAAGVADDAHVFVAAHRGVADERGFVTTAWNLVAIEEQYAEFIRDFRSPHATDLLARQIELVHAWRRFPASDPLLPRELLPTRWSGLEAARLFRERHTGWLTAARAEWARLNAGE
jgi:phenylacetic acid degradation operon negative regulatory protein